MLSPDFTNADRAEAALTALDSYTQAKEGGRYAEEPIYDRIADLMCDLLHLASQTYVANAHGDGEEGFDFIKLLWRARMNYEEECEDEAEESDDRAECQNCGETFSQGQLDDIKDYDERVAPGEDEPVGQCPSCGALCHLVGVSE